MIYINTSYHYAKHTLGFGCLLCQLETQATHGLCQDCWQNLPWRLQCIHKHQLSIHCIFDYQFPINRIIQKFKYLQQLQYQRILLHALYRLKPTAIDAIVAMPISKQRLIERGYNQSLYLAQRLAKHWGCAIWQPIHRHAEQRQKGLNRFERMENIQQQFYCPENPQHPYTRVLMLDDVVTTGSSLFALAQALQQLGCQQIDALCLAAAT
ncbi:ComF family protein [Acinetobacter larvae]|uniref:Amidophosphoribosyltransferase n=1 Tax=Acinetobacter larvae TaxID=1789224 RepID=A0A1B2LWD9_9GAMM|nr:ComF family protein [Acinetobacter larvae]AOA57244.1 hypothetical protein BFG52_01980 [Acinetobacter larvae]